VSIVDWDEYEKQTGIKRPAWIDGVGNINYNYGKKDPLPAKPLTAEQTAGLMPQVQQQRMTMDLMPQPGAQASWRPGLRGWRPGW